MRVFQPSVLPVAMCAICEDEALEAQCLDVCTSYWAAQEHQSTSQLGTGEATVRTTNGSGGQEQEKQVARRKVEDNAIRGVFDTETFTHLSVTLMNYRHRTSAILVDAPDTVNFTHLSITLKNHWLRLLAHDYCSMPASQILTSNTEALCETYGSTMHATIMLWDELSS